MEDREIRIKILELVRDNPSIGKGREIAKILRMPLSNVEANLEYLAARNYLESFHFADGSVEYAANENSRAYLSAPDVNAPRAGGPGIRASTDPFAPKPGPAVAEAADWGRPPQQYHSMLEDLLETIQNASCPKKEQAAKVKSFLDAVAASQDAKAVADCAVRIFGSAIGLPQ